VKVFPTLLHQTYHQTQEIALFSAYHRGELSQLIPPFNNLQQPLEKYNLRSAYKLFLYLKPLSPGVSINL
jgi:hypothetical protein